jgi:hypothetical protein
LIHYFPQMTSTCEVCFQTGMVTSIVGAIFLNMSCVWNLFRSLWQRFDFPFGSYRLDISFRQTSTESSTSAWDIIKDTKRMENYTKSSIVVKSSDTDVLVLLIHYFPQMTSTCEVCFQTGMVTSIVGTAFWLSLRIIQPWYQFSTDVNRIIYVCVRYNW